MSVSPVQDQDYRVLMINTFEVHAYHLLCEVCLLKTHVYACMISVYNHLDLACAGLSQVWTETTGPGDSDSDAWSIHDRMVGDCLQRGQQLLY